VIEKVIIITAIMACLIPTFAFCSDYYVDVNKGSNLNSGKSHDKAFRNITYALSRADGSYENPAVIHVKSGVYNRSKGEKFPIKLPSYVSLVGENCFLTKIVGTYTDTVLDAECSHCSVESFTFTGGDGREEIYEYGYPVYKFEYKYYGGGVYCSGSLNLKSCIIRDNTTGTRYTESGTTFYSGSYGGGIYCDDGSINLSNCLIINNESDYSGAIYSNAEVHMSNCTLIKNNPWLDPIGIYTIFTENIIENSIISADGTWYWTQYDIIDKWDETFVTILYSCIDGSNTGNGVIHFNPLFIKGPWGDYYLSQTMSGQTKNSPCLDRGSEQSIILNMDRMTTRTDGIFDSGKVDMGFHYPPHIQPMLHTDQYKTTYRAGDSVDIMLDLITAPANINVDIYFAMMNPDGNLYTYPAWDDILKPLAVDIELPGDLDLGDINILSFSIPSEHPPIKEKGTYSLLIAVTKPATSDLLSEISSVSFKIE
jgi:hypothetical protein